MGTLAALLEALRDEFLLFAAIGLLIGGIDDLLLDLIYLARRLWRALTVYARVPRMTARDLPPPGAAGPIAIFIPAWDESAVIGPMLRRCLDLWRGEAMQIFVGVYPNDPATLDTIARVLAPGDVDKVTVVVNPQPGPTTKADCLNRVWAAMRRWEAAGIM